MTKINDDYFINIKDEIEKFYKNNQLELEQLRAIEDVFAILEALEVILRKLDLVFLEKPNFLDLFEKDFGSFEKLVHEESIAEIALKGQALFFEKNQYPFIVDGKVSHEMLESYKESIQIWVDESFKKHQKNLENLKESVLNLRAAGLECSCVECLGIFRGRYRDDLYKECQRVILSFHDEIQANFDEVTIEKATSLFNDRNSTIQKYLYQARRKLKRSSLNKIEKSIKQSLKNKLGYDSELGKKYSEKIIPVLNDYLEEEGISKDIVDEKNYDKFFRLISSNLWRNEKYLTREFSKFISSVLKLKRKDISSTILQEYLGQFWLHSDARRKKRKIIYHMGPTNSGKTFHAVDALCSVKKGCYLAPLRLLAGELYDTMNAKGVKTTLLTGEEVIELEGATHYSSTVEMVKLKEEFDCAVIDEIQMMSDPQRGWAWTRALIGLNADVIHICGEETVIDLVKEIIKLTGDTLELKKYERLTKLEVLNNPVTVADLEKGDALIVFSRRNALKYKSHLEKLDFKVSIVYGRLGPEVRREQARKFDSGETDIIVSTDAIAMGMNLPIRRIVFTALSKFIDSEEYELPPGEIKQIAGRAGRYLKFPTGYITALQLVEEGIPRIKDAMETNLDQKELAMVGPDLEIFSQVNNALRSHNLQELSLVEFLRLFNTMDFVKPFYCVNLNEMIELAEIVEDANGHLKTLKDSDIFGFACAPVHLGLADHLQYYIHILNQFVRGQDIDFEEIDYESHSIDYLETAIKCTELFQWLSRHFDGRNFKFDNLRLQENKSSAISKLNSLLSEKIVPTCSSCGIRLPYNSKFPICENCFLKRKNFARSRDRRSFQKKGANGPYSQNRKSTKKGTRTEPKKTNFRGKKTRKS